MRTTEDLPYPADLRRRDAARGRADGRQHIPALSEVHRRLRGSDEGSARPAFGYELVLLTEFTSELRRLVRDHERAASALERDLARARERVEEAERAVRRAEEHLAVASELTAEQLRPRNPQEERWDPETLRNRREWTRSRRVRHAREALDTSRERLHDRRAELAAALRRRSELTADLGARVQRVRELYQRRIATYIDALVRAHPHGRALYPLLTMPDIPLPDWVPGAHPSTGGEQEGE